MIKVMGVKRRTSAVGLSSAKKPAMFVMVSLWREESQRRSSANFSIPGHHRVDWVVGAMPAQVTNPYGVQVWPTRSREESADKRVIHG